MLIYFYAILLYETQKMYVNNIDLVIIIESF